MSLPWTLLVLALAIVQNPAQPNPKPYLFSPRPASIPAGSPEQTLQIDGGDFTRTSTVRYNGQDRVTTFRGPGAVSFALTAADLASPGFAEITVSNPGPGGGVTAPVYFAVTLEVQASGMVYDAKRDTLWISVPGANSKLGNQVVPIDDKGRMGPGIFVGSEPSIIVISDDSHYLYVALDGAGAVRRVDLTTGKADLQFAVGSDPKFGTFSVADMSVMPGNAHTVAIARKSVSAFNGVAVFDDGKMRPSTTIAFPGGADRVEWSSETATIFGLDTHTSSTTPLRTLTVEPQGITRTQEFPVTLGFDMKYEKDRVYGLNGVIVDGKTLGILGTYSFKPLKDVALASGVVPDQLSGRTYFSFGDASVPNGVKFAAFDQATFTLQRSWIVPGFEIPVRAVDQVLAHWGKQGLAARGKGQLFLFRP